MKLNRIRRKRAPLILEITPLIDVVFLLLIFFLVATSFKSINSGIKIDLPQSNLKEIQNVDEIKLIITKEKEYFISLKEKGKVKTTEIKEKNLEKVLKEELQKTANKNVVISADKMIDHGTIVDAMTTIKKAGATSIDIDTEPVGD